MVVRVETGESGVGVDGRLGDPVAADELSAQVPPADPGWFIDMLGLNAADLARHLPTTAPAPREVWTCHTGADIHDDKWSQNT